MLEKINSSEQLNDLIASCKTPLIVAFLKSGCGPCIMAKPRLIDLAKSPNVTIAIVEDTYLDYDIKATPTFYLYRNGNEIDNFVGYRENQLRTFFAEGNSQLFNVENNLNRRSPFGSTNLSGERDFPDGLSLEDIDESQTETIKNSRHLPELTEQIKIFRFYQTLLLAWAASATVLTEITIKKSLVEPIIQSYQNLTETERKILALKLKDAIFNWSLIQLVECQTDTNDEIFYKINVIKGYGRINSINFIANLMIAKILFPEYLADNQLALIELANYFRIFISGKYRQDKTIDNKEEMISYYKNLLQEIDNFAIDSKIAKTLKNNLEKIIKNADDL